MPDRSGNSPRNKNQFAEQPVHEAMGAAPTALPADDVKDPAAVALGRKGGLKGGKARAAKLSADERRESARRAATARWAKRDEPTP